MDKELETTIENARLTIDADRLNDLLDVLSGYDGDDGDDNDSEEVLRSKKLIFSLPEEVQDAFIEANKEQKEEEVYANDIDGFVKCPTRNYKFVKQMFERNHFYHRKENKVCVWTGVSYDDRCFISPNPRALAAAYGEVKYEYRKKVHNKDTGEVEWKVGFADFFEEWLADNDKKAFVNMRPYPPPQECPKNCVNTWSGLHYDKLKSVFERKDVAIPLAIEQETIDIFDKLIENALGWEYDRKYPKNVYDNPTVPLKTWLKCLLGQRLTNPGINPEVMVLIIDSRQSIGKTFFWRIWGKLMGDEHYQELPSFASIFDASFSDFMIKQMINIDELGDISKNRQYKEKLKNLITAKKWKMNRKHIQEENVNFSGMIVGSSNELNPLDISSVDRRFLVCKGEGKINGYNGSRFFSEIGSWTDLQYYIIGKHCCDIYEKYMWSPTELQVAIPMTKTRMMMNAVNRDYVCCFFWDLAISFSHIYRINITKGGMVKLFNWYLKETGINNYSLSSNQFHNKVDNYCVEGKIDGICKTVNNQKYDFFPEEYYKYMLKENNDFKEDTDTIIIIKQEKLTDYKASIWRADKSFLGSGLLDESDDEGTGSTTPSMLDAGLDIEEVN